MTDAIVAVVLDQLISIIAKETNQQVRLVVGVKKEIKKLTSYFRAIQAVLLDAERRGLKEMAARDWLDKLKNACYDLDDVLDEWNTAILKLQSERAESAHVLHKTKVCLILPSPRFCFKQVGLRREIALKIKRINKNINSIVREKDMFNIDKSRSIEEPPRIKSTSFVDVSVVIGRDKEKNYLKNKLLHESNEDKNGVHIISIVGMGGMGKTTLAQLVYNDGEVKSNFDKRIWVCVSDPFDEVRIAKAIIEGLTDSVSNFTELESLLKHIHESVSKKKFLLVLDDVWTEEYNKWEPLYNSLRNGLQGSKILVTTRKSTVAGMMESIDIIDMEELSKDGSWLLFKRLAFFDRPQQECEKLEDIGREIVGKCKGLPLALKTVGSLLRFKKTREQWQRILDNEIWKLEEFEKGLFPPLLLSYNDLPSKIKRCFSYCAVFPKDYEMEKDELIKLWLAQGYLGLKQNQELEIVGEEYFNMLAMCSFFQDFKKDDDDNIIKCKMHDIVHDFAQFLVKNECFTMGTSSDEDSSCSYVNARHLKMTLEDEKASFPTNICSIFKIRSLIVRWKYNESSSISICLSNLFKQLTSLRALTLDEVFEENLITKIPSEIGKLIHLRYLNMSSLRGIKELPDTLCELYNLQTLNMSFCSKLEKLPDGMGKLINLRHLISNGTFALSCMPKGIERLVFLRTLSKLVVGGDGHNSQVCSLDSLKKLEYLRGSLEIRGLGNVIDGAEAKNANLKSKKYLLHLKLYFDYKSEASSTEVSTKDEAVLEALHAPPNLEKLVLTCYRGITMSFYWMASLTQLRKLTLRICINCEHLPPLGRLPLLERLQIIGMRSLKSVGNEFLGIKINDSSSSSSSSLILFPKLKSLFLEKLENWEDWEYEITENFAIMPCLSDCDITECPKLKALPNHFLQATSLERLNIDSCPVLKQWAEIYHHLPITSYSEVTERL
ncbi:hypothetical protein Ddye_014566 [Dipteronia dyeriana]|uniref:Uncharacterized protein n=1 Tax=Dipteronia dyeriana TaxID=168575 RepID=A0AAD9X8H9_9ROSI|nr:hypothetical protein Ddye_014566 [Dipteronia dyeriana]